MYFFRETGKPPLCRSKKVLTGCPVGDCAPDPRIEWAVSQFIKAKELANFAYASRMIEEMLDGAGFLGNSALLYACETVYAEYQEREAMKRQQQRQK
jgi:hypothetical protein